MQCPSCGDSTVTVPHPRFISFGSSVRKIWDKEETCKNCGWSESSGLPEQEDEESEVVSG